jgi:hypothetical protein
MRVVEESFEMFHPFNSEVPSKLISVNIKCQKNEEMQYHGFGYLSYEGDKILRFDGPCIMENGKIIEALLFLSAFRTMYFIFDKDGKPYFSTNYKKNENKIFSVERLVQYSGEVRDGFAHGQGKTFFSSE